MRLHLSLVLCLGAFPALAQNLPEKWTLDAVNHRMTIGNTTDEGLYDKDIVRTFYLEFDQANYWTLLENNWVSGTYIPATLTVDGITYPEVGVSFKGQTSYMMVQDSEKKSFAIKTDEYVAGQDVEGYNNFNLNNAFDDPSFMKEFLYYYLIDKHVPAAKCCYVQLVINGESWGLYPSVQQLNKDFTEEWYLSNDGTMWRADSPEGGMPGGGGGGGGPQWGDGTAALNYLGDAQSDYDSYYTLKSTSSADPWSYLITTCDALNNTPDAQLYETLPGFLDIDRTLWFLAIENAFADDDSYIYKGKMDYYCYWEPETGRLVPQEYDGNSILASNHLSWSPLYNVNNANYPLLNQLLNVPIWRQRYLAHLRTVIEDLLDQDTVSALLDTYSDMIDPLVEADDKKLYSYTQFVTGVNNLLTNINSRRNTLLANAEVSQDAPVIEEVVAFTDGGDWAMPLEGESASVRASVSATSGIFAVNLYYSTTLVGNFTMVQMLDDGQGSDASAGDGIYTAVLPAQSLGSFVRFYVEAVENDLAKSQSYLPSGAEHDVFYLNVGAAWADSDLVINELHAANAGGSTDEASEYEDWIEVYNTGTETIDLTGYHLTDNQWNLTKWEFPEGQQIAPGEYLIVWADEDSAQGPLHCNFKLSADGEVLTLLDAAGFIADEVVYGLQDTDIAYARVPNGFGPFVQQAPTFASNNDVIGVEEKAAQEIVLYPNPGVGIFWIRSDHTPITLARVYDLSGRMVWNSAPGNMGLVAHIDLGMLASGQYIAEVHTDASVSHLPVILKKD